MTTWPTCSIQWTRVNSNTLPDHVTEYSNSLGGEWTYRLRSPGRINLIGEHVDYTGGLVLPAAIDYAIYFVVRKIDRPEWRLHAVDLGETYTLPLPIEGRTDALWVDYLAGIGVQYQDRGHFLPGLEIVFGGDLPRGSGMSSSAALEGGMAFLLNHLLRSKLDRPQLASLCKQSSNTFLGIPSGVMDQYASLNGRASGPIVINCHTLESEPVKNAIDDHELWLLNTMVSHDLSDGAYGKRVTECGRALQAIQVAHPEVEYLSAASSTQLADVADRLDEMALQRAGYVIAENERVRSAITALEAGSSREFGKLLNETHAGLRDKFEVSCEELDFLQREAVSLPGVAGARMMGGGFGGCTINLVRSDAGEAFKLAMRDRYQKAYGIELEIYPVTISDGTDFI